MIPQKAFAFALSILYIFSLSGCKDLEAEIPSYLVINNITVNTTDVDQGSNSSSFSDAYVYVNDKLVGIYHLPATIPLLHEGNLKLTIGGGIKQNGVYQSRLQYPFYNRFDTTLTLVRGESVEINPSIVYNENVKFDTFFENFETGVNFEKGTTSDTTIVRTNDPNESFEGYSGKVILDEGKNQFEIHTPDISDIPRFNSSPVYLELNFRGNIFANFGSYFDDKNDNQIYVILPPKDEWTKVYINLTEMLGTNGNAKNFNFFFSYSKRVSNFQGTAEFYIDNVKIVTF